MKKATRVLCFLLLSLTASRSNGQTPAQLIADWERAKAYTAAYLDAMPEEGYAFKPTADMKTFAEQMLHFTDANYELASLAAGIKNPIGDGAAGKSADKSKSATTKMVMAGYDFVINLIKSMKPEQLQENILVFGKYTMTKSVLFNKIFEHQTHHRGQTTVYLHLMHAKVPDQQLF